VCSYLLITEHGGCGDLGELNSPSRGKSVPHNAIVIDDMKGCTEGTDNLPQQKE